MRPGFLQLLLKFLFGIGAFRFGEFVFHFGVACNQVHLGCAFEQNFIVNQFIQNAQLERERLFLRGCGCIGVNARAEDFLDVLAENLLAVHHRPDVRPRGGSPLA